MSYLRQFETLTEVISLTGQLYGKTAYALNIKGRRAGFTSITLFNDVKEFDNAVADIPSFSAATLDIISSSASDTNAAGTGVRTVKVTYINNLNALVTSAAIALNGTTLVTSVLTNVNEVLFMETDTAGSGGKAAGNIRLRINGGVVEVEQISVQANKSMSARFMVPTGYTAYVPNWRVAATNNDQDARIQATVNTLDRSLASVYMYQSNAAIPINSNSSTMLLPLLKFPALSRIKVSTISAGAGATIKCDVSFVVILIAD